MTATRTGPITKEEYLSFKKFFEGAENAMHGDSPGVARAMSQRRMSRWKGNTSLPHIPSVLAYRGRIHAVTYGGITTCYNAESGELLYRARLPDTGTYYASPVATDGKIYFASLRGVVTVIEAAPELKIVAKNRFGEEITASPAIVDSKLYLRTARHLYAFGE